MSDNLPSKPDQPTEEQITTLLSGFKPDPRQQFYHKMRKAPWFQINSRQSVKIKPSPRAIRWSTFAILTIILILTLFISIPSLSTSARQLFRFFLPNDENSRSIEITQVPTSTTDSPFPDLHFSLSLEEAENEAGFPLQELTSLPKGVVLEGAAFDSHRKAVLLRYVGEGQTILLTQREVGGVQEFASIGSGAPVQLVPIRGSEGEFVTGGWIIQAIETPQPGSAAQTVKLTWDHQASLQTLRWQEQGFIYEIVVAGRENISLGEIVAIAESMR